MTNEEIIRVYYSGFEKKDWSAVESLLADGFTFTSPNNDDHIDKRTFKEKCWPQADWVERFELENVIGKGTDTFVKYLCRTNYGRSFRNTEYFKITDGKIKAIECYFGGNHGYPSQHASISQPEIAPGAAGRP
jgi:ketosteroid isomerase-like protein